MTVDFLTKAWITADSTNPRISAQVICHVIDAVMDSACKMAWIRLTSHTSRALNRYGTPQGYTVPCPRTAYRAAPVDSRA